ncbi:MAG: ComEC/Rec2 family competence protein, partial [Oscillospiraceae bacterium]|nr:ComEC/Rec2 family competence protein [Oscillospiraceae bacterium]
TSLAFSLFLILLYNPYAIGSVSLQLSYAAVGGILWLTPKAMQYVGGHGRIVYMVLSSFAVTMGACIFTLPLCAYYFGRTSLVMFLSNLLCLGVVSASFMAGLLAVLVSMIFPPLAGVLAFAANYGAEYTLWMAEALASLPHHALYFCHPANVAWLCYVYALVLLCVVFSRVRYRIAVAAGLVVVSLMFTLTLTERSFRDGALHIVALDVGQGQCVLAMRGEYAAVIDCGSSTSYIDAGEIAADHLLTAGHRDIDALVLTHSDADHVNGLERLAARLEIRNTYHARDDDLPEEVAAVFAAAGLNPTMVQGAKCIENKAFTIDLYSSNAGSKRSNDHGLAAKISCGDFSFLATGDMSAAAEEKLLADYAIGEVDALLVGHHGSSRATDREVLKTLSPAFGVISVGENSYGHPAQETLYRLSDEKMAVYRTDLQGNIHIRVN